MTAIEEMMNYGDQCKQFKKEITDSLERHRVLWRLNGVDLDAAIMAEHLIESLNKFSHTNYKLNHRHK